MTKPWAQCSLCSWRIEGHAQLPHEAAADHDLDVERLARALYWVTEDSPGTLATVDQVNTEPHLLVAARAIAAAYETDV